MSEHSSTNVRLTAAPDLPVIRSILDKTSLFPSDALEEMIGPFLQNSTNTEIWLTALSQEQPVGFCYARAEDFTDGTWNLLAIAVDPASQSTGVGSNLVQHLEMALRGLDQRLLIVDTSSTEDLENAREFYKKRTFTQEAVIRNYWSDGDDKVTFAKSLRPAEVPKT